MTPLCHCEVLSPLVIARTLFPCHCEEPSPFVIARRIATKQSQGKEIATPRQVGARNDSTDGLLTPKMVTLYCYLIGMFKNVIVGHLLSLSLRGPIYRAEAISVRSACHCEGQKPRSNLGGASEGGDCHASPSLCSGLWLTAMTKGIVRDESTSAIM